MKKKLSIVVAVLALVLSFGLAGCTTPPTNEQLYAAAVLDAMTIEEDEVLPLVTLSADSAMANVNENGEVLLLSWHKYPDSYTEGSEIVNTWGEIWAFTDKEILSRYNTAEGVTDWEMRLRQLIGVPVDKTYTHFSAVWVKLDKVIRPAYETDVTKQMKTSFDENVDQDYKTWFDGNIVWSYFDSAYPWTRLGYTYDWADNGKEYGLSEFLIRPDTELRVEFTKSNTEFVEWLRTN